MDFNICADCGGDDLGILALAFVWCVPTLVYAVRHQGAVGPAAMRFLGVVQYVLMAAAIVFSLRWFGLLHPLFMLIGAFVVVACVAAVGLRRMSRQGSPEKHGYDRP